MPYTSHGHPYGVIDVDQPKPRRVARCGGPALCKKCAVEAAENARPAEPFPPDIPAEAVEAAAQAMRDNNDPKYWAANPQLVPVEHFARVALAAALPHIRAHLHAQWTADNRRPTETDQPCIDNQGPAGVTCIYPRHHETHYANRNTTWTTVVETKTDQPRKALLAEIETALQDWDRWKQWHAGTNKTGTWPVMCLHYLRDVLGAGREQ